MEVLNAIDARGKMTSADPTILSETFSIDSRFLVKWTRFGPPESKAVVFVHGTPWTSRLCAPFALALSKTYCVYLFDNPNYGKSEAVGSDLEEQATDGALFIQAGVLATLLKHWQLDARPPHVIAHDNAGLVSLRALLQHGCKFRSLFLVDVVAVGPWGLPFFKLVADNVNVFEQIPNQLFSGIIKEYIQGAAYKKALS